MTTPQTTVALRVLTAINNRRPPEERDIALLRAFCPDHRDLDPDELACAVIQKALKAKRASQDAKDGKRTADAHGS